MRSSFSRKADPISNAQQLKSDADKLLQEFEPLMRQFGDVIYTGSYALDLMAWNDIDLYMVPKADLDLETCVADLSAAFAKRKDVEAIRVEKALWKKRPELPKGLFLGIKIASSDYELPWKLDIWIVHEDVILANLKLMSQIREKLTPSKRELILLAKAELIHSGRTPSMSGVRIYEAVLDKDLRSVSEIKRFATQPVPFSDFEKVDIRSGTVVKAEAFPKAKKPAYKVWVDFGEEIGVLQTSAQITQRYTLESLLGRQVAGVVNFGIKNIAGFESQFLLLGFSDLDHKICLATSDPKVPNGRRLH